MVESSAAGLGQLWRSARIHGSRGYVRLGWMFISGTCEIGGRVARVFVPVASVPVRLGRDPSARSDVPIRLLPMRISPCRTPCSRITQRGIVSTCSSTFWGRRRSRGPQRAMLGSVCGPLSTSSAKKRGFHASATCCLQNHRLRQPEEPCRFTPVWPFTRPVIGRALSFGAASDQLLESPFLRRPAAPHDRASICLAARRHRRCPGGRVSRRVGCCR